jgi:hypothetical protein
LELKKTRQEQEFSKQGGKARSRENLVLYYEEFWAIRVSSST